MSAPENAWADWRPPQQESLHQSPLLSPASIDNIMHRVINHNGPPSPPPLVVSTTTLAAPEGHNLSPLPSRSEIEPTRDRTQPAFARPLSAPTPQADRFGTFASIDDLVAVHNLSVHNLTMDIIDPPRPPRSGTSAGTPQSDLSRPQDHARSSSRLGPALDGPRPSPPLILPVVARARDNGPPRNPDQVDIRQGNFGPPGAREGPLRELEQLGDRLQPDSSLQGQAALAALQADRNRTETAPVVTDPSNRPGPAGPAAALPSEGILQGEVATVALPVGLSAGIDEIRLRHQSRHSGLERSLRHPPEWTSGNHFGGCGQS